MSAVFGRFSKASERALVETQALAERLSRPIQSDLFLLALASFSDVPAGELLRQVGATPSALLGMLSPVETPLDPDSPSYTSRELQAILEEAIRAAARFRFNSVEPEHILFAIVDNTDSAGHKLLKRLNIQPGQIISRLFEWLSSVSSMSNAQQQMRQGPERGPGEDFDLEKYVTDVTEDAEDGQLDPVIGRQAELEQMVHILLRRRKNNPLLVGEPGVGKTALVDALASRIIAGNVPPALRGKRLLTLDLASIVAGTMYRGQFEERLKRVIEEVIASGNTILFIDEIHTLSGTGSSEGGFDAANILKPALARGDLSLIGATTHEEYRKYIRKDKALDRRFQMISVEEPTPTEAIAMVKGVKRELEHHHHVQITEPAIRSAVELSVRYIHDRFLPDKAIDVLDEAATHHANSVPEDPELVTLQREVNLVSMEKSEVIEMADSQDDWALARELSEKETQLLRQLQHLHKINKKASSKPKVTAEDVARVISRRTGIPAAQVSHANEPVDIARVRSQLTTQIIGQDEAISSIAKALTRAHLGLQQEGKPVGSFLLVGPTGVGKTETARAIAAQVYGDPKALIKFDMSEYGERHTVSNLIGAPAGYVGFEQGGSLTEQVSRRPYSVILFDEVEKAHPDVFNLLLQILEDGVLTDNTGRQTSFAHTIVILTSNIGLENYNASGKIGFSTAGEVNEEENKALEEHIRHEVTDYFRPELLGRLTEVICYKPLSKTAIEILMKRRMDILKKQLKQRKISLTISANASNWIKEQYQSDSGARSIDRIFLTKVEPVILEVLSKPHTNSVTLTVKGDELAAHTSTLTTETHIL